MEISQSVLKDKYPELYREDIYPVIDQGDFRLKDLEWTSDNRVKFAPDYIDPEDLFYEVTLYYEKWHEDKFKKTFTAIIYIVEKTRESYLIRLGSEYYDFHSLLKPNKED